jgi:exodeoxyribonuclease III
MKLRLVSWNCNMALHLKFERLLALAPDIAVVQECADPGLDLARGREHPFAAYEWAGYNPNKGLGIFTFGNLRLARDPAYSDEFALHLPVTVEGACRLNVLGVWVVPKAPPGATNDPRRALEHYSVFLAQAPTVVAGDFNMLPQQMTRRPAAPGSRSIAALLAESGLKDADALASELWPGRPLKRTHFHQRKPRRGFVNDYIFIPDSAGSGEAAARLTGFDVCDPHEWITWSDHVPLVLDLELPA